eukprot:g14364.t1
MSLNSPSKRESSTSTAGETSLLSHASKAHHSKFLLSSFTPMEERRCLGKVIWVVSMRFYFEPWIFLHSDEAIKEKLITELTTIGQYINTEVIKEKLITELTTIGVVAALLAAMLYGEWGSPPECMEVVETWYCNDTMKKIFAVSYGVAIAMQLGAVLISMAYLSLFNGIPVEMTKQLFCYLLWVLPVPFIYLSLGILFMVPGIFAQGLLVYGEEVSLTLMALLAIFFIIMVLCCLTGVCVQQRMLHQATAEKAAVKSQEDNQ